MKFDTGWNKIGKYWTLISFEKEDPGTLDEYLNKQENYWGDRIYSKKSYWGGDKKKWLEEQKEKYKEWVDYCDKWCGIFSLNQKIHVVQQDKRSVVKLIEVVDDYWKWDSCIELWKVFEINILPPKFLTKCEMYSFGKLDGKVISHYRGDYKLSLEEDNSIIKLTEIKSTGLSQKGETVFRINEN
tara:strand:+ start:70 stop:624 length:555 start_codon:yes stop_codon:yes gene_type:complete